MVIIHKLNSLTRKYFSKLKTEATIDRETDIVWTEISNSRIVGKVEEAECKLIVRKVLEHSASHRTRGRLNYDRRTGLRIRINTEEILILKQVKYFGTYSSQVCTDHEGRSHHTPKSEMGLILDVTAEAGVTDVTDTVHTADKHIKIIIATGCAVLELIVLAE